MSVLAMKDPSTIAAKDNQLEQWVQGNPVHNDVDGECCPDFSCCKPELLAEPDVRKAFAAAGTKDRMRFLGTFLGAAMALHGKQKVHIIKPGREEQ